MEKSEKMGLPWTEFMDEQWASLPDLQAKADALTNPAIKIPDYYFAPIHAYKDGNLCWESAMEEDLWSKLMIAPLYNNALDGDVQMRQKWLGITQRALKYDPVTATDLGCGTGLSMYMLDSKFPSIKSVTGVDLSTYKLAVCAEKMKEMVRFDVPSLLGAFLTSQIITLFRPLKERVNILSVMRLLSKRRSQATPKTWPACAWWHTSRLNGLQRAYLRKPTEY